MFQNWDWEKHRVKEVSSRRSYLIAMSLLFSLFVESVNAG